MSRVSRQIRRILIILLVDLFVQLISLALTTKIILTSRKHTKSTQNWPKIQTNWHQGIKENTQSRTVEPKL